MKEETMKTYRLANAEKLLKEIVEFFDDNMGLVTHRGERDQGLFVLSNEMKIVRDKIQKYLLDEEIKCPIYERGECPLHTPELI